MHTRVGSKLEHHTELKKSAKFNRIKDCQGSIESERFFIDDKGNTLEELDIFVKL